MRQRPRHGQGAPRHFDGTMGAGQAQGRWPPRGRQTPGPITRGTGGGIGSSFAMTQRRQAARTVQLGVRRAGIMGTQPSRRERRVFSQRRAEQAQAAAQLAETHVHRPGPSTMGGFAGRGARTVVDGEGWTYTSPHPASPTHSGRVRMRAEVAHETSPSPQAARARTSYFSPLDQDGGDPTSRHLQYEDGRQAMSISQSAVTGAVHDPFYDSAAEDMATSRQAPPLITARRWVRPSLPKSVTICVNVQVVCALGKR